MKDRIFYAGCFGLVVGVLLRSFILVNTYFALFILGLCTVVFIFSYFSQLKWIAIISILLLTASVGILKFNFEEFSLSYTHDGVLGTKIQTEGRIIEAPDVRENNQKLVVEEDISGLKTKFLVTASLGQHFKYGDQIKFTGKIEKPENFLTDTGKEFDYVNYLKKDGILYTVNFADIEVESRGNGNPLKAVLFGMKEKFLDKINFAIPAPESLLMGGLILGEKSAFSQDLRQSFVDTGTIHIVALSGYNVTIVAEWFMKIFSFLPRNLGIGVGILAIILFIIMTGAGSTALRAGIMAVLALIARATGRNYDVARALILAGVIMIFINPMILVYDVSFQLSFIATVAVIFFTPKIEKYFLWVPEVFKMRDIVATTSAAYIFVLPFILYKMGNLSLVALPANVLILPFIPLTMLFGFFTGLVGFVSHILAVPVGYLSYLLLHYELSTIEFLSRIPFAALSIPNFSLWFTILIYVYFVCILFGRSMKQFFILEPR